MITKGIARAFAAAILVGNSSAEPTFDCNPCINRANHVIKAIVQGTKSEPFWKQVEMAMRQAAKDMGVGLELELYDTLDTDKMAADIRSAASSNDPPEAMIVTMPSDNVQSAVKDVVEDGMPVFGFYSGYEQAEEIGTTGFIAMDQELAGEEAANQFLSLKESVGTGAKVAFVSPAEPDGVFYSRLHGMENVFDDVDVIVADELYSVEFDGCPYDFVLLASSELMKDTFSAYKKHGCNFSEHPIGTFDRSSKILEVLKSGELAFTVSQEQYLQGAFSVVAAALFATIGKSLAPSSDSPHGIQTVGPRVITRDNLPEDRNQVCENDAFPVCPHTLALDGKSKSNCPCTDRKKVKIAGVLHAVTTDEFWDVVYESSEHAANDFGIDLELGRFKPEDNSDVLHEKMAGQIEALCKSGIDGLFVTIPNDIVHEAINFCMSRNVPVISINAGPDDSEDLGLYHHIGMIEYSAGVQAGKRMAKAGIRKALCLMHAPNNVVLTDRCSGFKEGLKSVDSTIEYLGDLDVPENNDVKHKKDVETYVESQTGDTGSWQGIGILLGGAPQIEPGLNLKKDHSSVVLGTFDSNDMLFNALEEGKILFAIDQGPYLQGYLPVALLTWQAYTGQWLSNHKVESGPAFIERAPSAEESACQAMHFPVCAKADENEVTSYAASPESTSDNESTDDNKGAIIAISVIIVVLGIVSIFLVYRVHALNKYVRQVKDEGKEVPKLTMGSYCSSMYQSPEEVMSHATDMA